MQALRLFLPDPAGEFDQVPASFFPEAHVEAEPDQYGNVR
jgi:hypothetical protein